MLSSRPSPIGRSMMRNAQRALACAALPVLAVIAGCAAETRQLPPALNPSSAEAPEGSEQTPRSLAGPLAREATPLEPSTEADAAAKNPDMAAAHSQHLAGEQPGGEQPGVEPEAKTIYTCPMHPEVRQDRPGSCPKCGMKLVPEKRVAGEGTKRDGMDHSGHAGHADGNQPGGEPKAKAMYTCPMHPEVRQDRPGSCPKCGMELVPEKKGPADLGHGGHP